NGSQSGGQSGNTSGNVGGNGSSGQSSSISGNNGGMNWLTCVMHGINGGTGTSSTSESRGPHLKLH
ncbi:predicted GPI-anchored protein 37, partial [Ceratina calcarata]|uniref:Predicted GPI-anchored protein 37 n=1 Tax=Ceratina calcarata TaxID=156304 RepID=A0AAJ7RY35_9HYME